MLTQIIVFFDLCTLFFYFFSFQHKQNIIHRDLKAENIFITGKNIIKVGDFGFSTRIQNAKEVLLTFCGSPPYVAPEIFQNENYVGSSVDLWSMGVLLYFIVTASLPFKGDTVSLVKRKILSGQYNIPKYVSNNCRDLISGMLQLDPTKRLSTNQIRNCAWMKDTKFPSERSSKNYGEKEVKETLEKMGITEKMLKEHQSKGAKSNVMGTYRILMHKKEQKCSSDENEKSSKKVVITCPLFQSQTCTLL